MNENEYSMAALLYIRRRNQIALKVHTYIYSKAHGAKSSK